MILISLQILSIPSLAQSQDELFEKAFGKKRTVAPRRIVVPLRVEDRRVEEIQVTTAASPDEILVEAAPLLKALESYLKPEWLTQIKSSVDAQGNLRLKALNDGGLIVALDERKLELRVTVPPEVRRVSQPAQRLGVRRAELVWLW